MSSSIFQNQDVETSFFGRGHVQLPILDAAKVDSLKTELLQLYDADLHKNSFFLFTDKASPEFVEKVFNIIINTCQDGLDAHFLDYKINFANSLFKRPSPVGFVPPHQDWSFTDESKYYSLTLWIPLVDTDEKSGTMGIIDGSHRFFDHPRSSPKPYSVPPLTPYHEILWPYVKPVKLKAGEALIFDNRTIHASFPNLLEETRPAIIVGLRPKEAALLHYFQVPDRKTDELEVIEVDHSFYFSNSNISMATQFEEGRIPIGKSSKGTLIRKNPSLSMQEMETLVESFPGNTKQQDVIEMLKARDTLAVTEIIPNREEEQEQEWKDPRSLTEKYTLPNILAEIRWRLKGRPL